MRPAKKIKYLIVNLYCKIFRGNPDDLEILDGPMDNYDVSRKEDGTVKHLTKIGEGKFKVLIVSMAPAFILSHASCRHNRTKMPSTMS